jgi:hypothetical protein
LPDAEPLLLDNIDPRLMPASQRPDLSPVYSFNDAGIWRGGAMRSAREVPALSLWADLQARVMAEMRL